MWKEFIVGAEGAWLRVFDSASKSNLCSPDEAPLMRLPMRWQRCTYIYHYFRQWWSPRMAKNMLLNLPLFERGGNLYVAAYDIPPISFEVSQVKILAERRGVYLLESVLVGGYDAPLSIKYIVAPHPVTKHFMIIKRSDRKDFRYRCSVAEE